MLSIEQSVQLKKMHNIEEGFFVCHCLYLPVNERHINTELDQLIFNYYSFRSCIRAGFSCSTSIHKFDTLSSKKQNGLYAAALFLDFCWAFAHVDHSIQCFRFNFLLP